MRKAIVFGGAGFIGSNVSVALVNAGWSVTVVDGFLPRTAAARANLASIIDRITLFDTAVEEIEHLAELMAGTDLVVDALGWTRHSEAAADPLYDVRLNIVAHIPIWAALPRARPGLSIYLGTRNQYGRVGATLITEDTPFMPVDEHGVHKVAADHHYRLLAERHELPIISLRFGNTFGVNQPVKGRDLGLIGGFIAQALSGETLVVYDGERSRNVLFAEDLARTILRLADARVSGWRPLNFGGEDISIRELSQRIVDAVGSGTVLEQPMPATIAAGDIGGGAMDTSQMVGLIGAPELTPLDDALAQTVAYFRQRWRRQM